MTAARSHPQTKTPDEQTGAQRSSAEWLETDGRGGFASGTVDMRASRRYHGLLVAVPPGTERRHVFLQGFLEQANIGEEDLVLSAHEGHTAACAFRATPWPQFTYRQAGLEVQREILMVRGQPTTLARYTAKHAGDAPWTLTLQPVLAFREADRLTVRNTVLRTAVETVPGGIRCRLYDALPAMTITVSAGKEPDWVFEPDPRWLTGLEYPTDRERGYEGLEDLFSPGRFVLRAKPHQAITVASTIDHAVANPGALWRAEAQRRRGETAHTPTTRDRLAQAADDFLYRDASGRPGVLAGFPWFGEWGRDTYIALPGLTLARGDLAGCADILSSAASFLRDGLLPNIFGTRRADSHYGSVDASLWFARAVLLYDRAGGDAPRVLAEYLPALREIATSYRDGTAPAVRAMGIRADEAGMLEAGTPALNPTWMDAQTHTGPVTPRYGCAVELAALWYSLLAYLAELTTRAGEGQESEVWREAAARAGEAFVARFCTGDGALADIWRPEALDTSVRPNMVLAAALELSPLTHTQRADILAVAEEKLLTSFGLRTLAPEDPAYVSRYEGGPEQRDRAYHQGTVWPWLLGFFCEASLRVDDGPQNRRRLRALWDTLEGELDTGCSAHLAEVYDADPPHRGGGSFAQAWNTAEMLRALALLDGDLPLGGVD